MARSIPQVSRMQVWLSGLTCVICAAALWYLLAGLTEADDIPWRKLRLGMSPEQVRTVLGEPTEVLGLENAAHPLLGETVGEYLRRGGSFPIWIYSLTGDQRGFVVFRRGKVSSSFITDDAKDRGTDGDG